MAPPTDNPYLRDAVLTAPPEQLQLMLYDGAIRFALQGQQAIQAGDTEKSYDALTRAQKIVMELLNGLREEVDPPLVRQVASIYMFIYRQLVEANVNKDAEAAGDAVKLLGHQRQTWVMLLDKLRADQSGPQAQPVTAPPDAAPIEAVLEADAPRAGLPSAVPPTHADYQPLSIEG